MAKPSITPPPRLRAVVHIGPIKTGSTAFTEQMTATQERGELPREVVYALPLPVTLANGSTRIVRPENIRYLAPRLEWYRGTGGEFPLGHKERPSHGNRAIAYVTELARTIRGEMTTDTTVFFVEETLARRPHAGDLTTQLLRHFDEVTYVFVARRQRNVIPSAISQRIKVSTYPTVWDPSVSSYLSVDNFRRQFDYADIARRWSSTDARVRLEVVPFLESDRGSQKLFHRILAVAGISLDLGAPVPRAVNATPTRFEMSALSAVKRLTGRFWVGHGDEAGAPRRLFDWFSEKFLPPIGRFLRSPRWTIADEEVALIESAYDEANAQFVEYLGARADSAEWREWFTQR